MVRSNAIGWRAHAGLGASGGVATVVAPLSRSFYAEAAGELIWVGGADMPLHPRAVLVPIAPVTAAGARVTVTLDGVAPWRAAMLRSPLPNARDSARTLGAALDAIGEPRGLARLLAAGGEDDLVTMQARPYVSALARACAKSDAAGFADAARPLLGLGTGFTPSGDDFVGGALFARRVLVGMDSTWKSVAARIVAEAALLTHPISARLLADLAAGEGWAPLHELSAALASKETAATITWARDVTALGHTSGWDVIAGLLTGLVGEPVVPTSHGLG
jgi:hypothetical protein